MCVQDKESHPKVHKLKNLITKCTLKKYIVNFLNFLPNMSYIVVNSVSLQVQIRETIGTCKAPILSS